MEQIAQSKGSTAKQGQGVDTASSEGKVG